MTKFAIIQREFCYYADHREFDYQMIVQPTDLIIDAHNATRAMTVPENKVIRL